MLFYSTLLQLLVLLAVALLSDNYFLILFFLIIGINRIFRVNKDDQSMPLRDEKTGFCVPADFGEVSL